ncbi:hypothetical protein Tco_1197439 [Tanacetum coccineum]
MGATFGSLRDRISSFIGDLIQSQFWGEGSSVEEEPNLEQGGGDELLGDHKDTMVRDHSGTIEVFDVVSYPCPPSATNNRIRRPSTRDDSQRDQFEDEATISSDREIVASSSD